MQHFFMYATTLAFCFMLTKIKIGLALRMAISLGLHQEVSQPDISEIERDRRRRAWWSVYSLDRYLLGGLLRVWLELTWIEYSLSNLATPSQFSMKISALRGQFLSYTFL